MLATLEILQADLERVMLRDRHSFARRLREIRHALNDAKPADEATRRLEEDVRRSVELFERRRAAVPKILYPPELPVSQRRDEIAQAIREHQVIVVCGETGSGKTTQLPKICLELGRGIGGMIGHTQPRRIAARTVANRIAQELASPLGEAVGFKIRFSDKMSAEGTYIKLMTDGILLAETQNDRFLSRYDTIIIDEAHERSLNIDFLLGYLKQLLPRRPDLKLIITSATINPQQFSDHFGGAPIVEVSGRTYPVETRYRPPIAEADDEEDPDPIEAIVNAIDEVWREERGDALVFLSGEREIRETADALREHHFGRSAPAVEILPLFSRLSNDEQMKIFSPGAATRIVLATNVAETSLTVPRIKYVIDPGFARMSRWSSRTKVQRLPIEHISQASAEQRKGRCGRVSDGVCVRLYAEDDFASRPAFTDPEILRTNLASVILQMKALGLGDVQDFPFLQPPDYRAIKDGLQTLHELGATNEHNQLTRLGRDLARLPIDPRHGRMILAAEEEQCLDEVLILAAVLSIQDPRERPMDKQQQADTAHAQWSDERSDFLGLLKLWMFYQGLRERVSASRLRKACKENFISYVRMREWDDVHQQLKSLGGEVLRLRHQRHFEHSSTRELSPKHIDAIHRSLLSGLLSNVGTRTEAHEYLGARGIKFSIFPGSALFKRKPAWVMAAELVETTKLYARTVATIQPHWLERAAAHLVKRAYTEPHWQRLSGHVAAFEKVTLFGLPIVPRRTVHYGPIEPVVSRQMFIYHALVLRDWKSGAEFFTHNAKLIEDIKLLETKRRNRDLMVEDQRIYDFYDKRISRDVYNAPLFEKWRIETEKHRPGLLFLHRRDVLLHEVEDNKQDYPDELTLGGIKVPLSYVFDPSSKEDGVTVGIPLAVLNQIPDGPFEWLVPGLLREKVIALMKSMPKALRVKFVPVPEHADRAIAGLQLGQGSLLDALAKQLGKIIGEVVDRNAFSVADLPAYLQMHFRVVDNAGETVTVGRDLEAMRRRLGLQARRTFAEQPPGEFHRDGITSWDFGDLPERVEIHRNAMTLQGYPALVDAGKAVSLRLLDSPEAAHLATRHGVRKLLMLQLREEVLWMSRHSPGIDGMALNYASIGSTDRFKAELVSAMIDHALFGKEREDVRTRQQFLDRAALAWKHMYAASQEIGNLVKCILEKYQSLQIELSKDAPPALIASYEDMRKQLDNLVYDGFILETPPAWLVHYPRFLAGIELRLRKLRSAALLRDVAAPMEITPLEREYHERRHLQHQLATSDPELELFWWMLQELRVSLFAQELKTSMPISVKRLESQWAKVRR